MAPPIPAQSVRALALGVIAALISLAAPVPAQQASAGRLTLGGKPPAITNEAEHRRFLDELESQEFAFWTAMGVEYYYQWRGEATNRATQTRD